MFEGTKSKKKCHDILYIKKQVSSCNVGYKSFFLTKCILAKIATMSVIYTYYEPWKTKQKITSIETSLKNDSWDTTDRTYGKVFLKQQHFFFVFV